MIVCVSAGDLAGQSFFLKEDKVAFRQASAQLLRGRAESVNELLILNDAVKIGYASRSHNDAVVNAVKQCFESDKWANLK